ncbi:MAG: hypothetical protein KAX11_08825, partial [Candidatus Aminicenantes bacterium]|nr:hypothetical protein [Candidatus Aminicenantes bacterium]
MSKNQNKSKKHITVFMFVLVLVFYLISFAASHSAEEIVIEWGGKAEITYVTGVMNMLMKKPAGGISLFNMELVENDAPGAGFSEKGA